MHSSLGLDEAGIELRNNVFTPYPNSHSTSTHGGKDDSLNGDVLDRRTGSEEKIIPEPGAEKIYVTRTTTVTVC